MPLKTSTTVCSPPLGILSADCRGCDNYCAYCVILCVGNTALAPWITWWQKPSGSRRWGEECIVVAQDITRYGMDFDGKRHLQNC